VLPTQLQCYVIRVVVYLPLKQYSSYVCESSRCMREGTKWRTLKVWHKIFLEQEWMPDIRFKAKETSWMNWICDGRIWDGNNNGDNNYNIDWDRWSHTCNVFFLFAILGHFTIFASTIDSSN
jgi:hypothetical protein